MVNKKVILKFRADDQYSVDAILDGRKKIETRAATEKYRDIKVGDTVVLSCGKRRVEKTVAHVEVFKTIGAILKKYKPEMINPKTRTATEARAMWLSFPGYKEKIKRYGLIALRLK